MQTIKLKITDDEARLWEAMLRKRYGKRFFKLNRLAEIAIQREVLAQLREDCYAAGDLLDDEAQDG